MRPGSRERGVGGAAERRRVAHRPVGVEREHLGVGVAAPGLPGGPDERRRGGGHPRLDQKVLGGNLEHLAQPEGQRVAGNDEHALARDQAGEALDGLLRRGTRRTKGATLGVRGC
jgi:hypothetical protein